MDEDRLSRILKNFFSDRVVILCFFAVLIFGFLLVKLFEIQIVNGQKYASQIRSSITKETVIEAPRGTIYDKFGKPLAMNEVAYSLKIDETIPVDNKNASILALIDILDANGETIIDEMPISVEHPQEFLFEGSQKKEERWKLDMGIEDMSLSAEESYRYLKEDLFQIPEGLPYDTERKLLAIRQSLALNRYNYNQFTVARNIKDKTIAMIEEKKHLFPSALVDVEPIRVYPEGSNFAHIVGYIRSINDAQLEEYKDYGYTENDIVGQTGIEKAMELSLKGTNGKKAIEADAIGRVIQSEIKEPAVPGDKVFLTIDAEFQRQCTEILKNSLRDVVLNKISGMSAAQLATSMVSINNKIINAAYHSSEAQADLYKIQQAFINDIEDFSPTDNEKLKEAKNLLEEKIKTGEVTLKNITVALFETGQLHESEEYIEAVREGWKTPMAVIREKLLSGELEPGDTGVDPSSGGIAVVDVHTGGVIALVTYPSYDTNELVNTFNMDYYNQLLYDENFPLTNRPTMTRKAPGSTFKMVTATTLLEEGVVTPTETITDMGVFTAAGRPYARCWINAMGGSHGAVNVTKAVEVSCNYFFYEGMYRLGNAATGKTIQSISTLVKYMANFGLDGPTGIEIEENMPRAASPEYKETVMKGQNPNATKSETAWMDGDTIRAAIGQSYNSFTPLSMAKYIATLANGGTRYKMHLIQKSADFAQQEESITEPLVESELNIKQANLDAIYRGMLAVTSGTQGTATGIFSSLPMKVAGKTGTAQEDLTRANHTWFVGFAPYDAPEIAVACMIPFGETAPSPSAVITREVISAYFDLAQQTDPTPYLGRIAK